MRPKPIGSGSTDAMALNPLHPLTYRYPGAA